MTVSARRLDHIGVAVKDLDGAIGLYRDVLGLKLEGIHVLAERGVRVAFFSVGDEAHIELLEPLNSESAIAKFLSAHGEGLHHLALKVDDIEAVLEEFKQKGMTLIDEKPKAGAEGKKIAFVHPKSTRGILLELCEGP
ncbi:MAG TPA: methylmalonyl-CoA epimerase [candidate division Zixibacteria bacterium]|nr:methylmalonyl-CoA epimerase [candidate division Zixibacteria bacterium]